MLEVIYENYDYVNQYFLILNISGSIFVTLILINILYYIYVEKSKLIAFASLYFFFSLIGLILSSLLILSSKGQIDSSYQRFIYNIDSLNDYFLVYSLFLILTTFIRRPLQRNKQILLVIIPLCFLLGYYSKHQWITFFLYLYITICITVYHLFNEIKSYASWRLVPAFFILLMPVVYYTYRFTADVDLANFLALEGLASILIVVIALVYFMFHYKLILQDKNRLYSLLTHDSLTGLYSKSYLLEQLHNTEKGIILFIDINNFKWLNDTHGHLYGDKLLIEFSRTMMAYLDSTNIVSRYGGDEFVLLSKNNSIESAQQLAIHIINIFKESTKTVLEKDTNNIGISIGISHYSNFDSKTALIQADQAMYKAKSNGNHKIVVEL